MGILFTLIQFIKSSNPTLPIFVSIFSALYLCFKDKLINTPTLEIATSKSFVLANNILFFILLTLFIMYIYYFEYPFDYFYYFILTLLASSIIVSILTSSNKWFLIFKIILLTTIIRASIFYAFPSIYGVDSIFHARFAEEISLLNHLPYSGEFDSYSYYPMYHLLLTSVNYVANIHYKDIMFLLGIIQLLTIAPVIYIIGKRVADEKVGFFAVFFFCTLGSVIVNYLIPNMFALAIFAILFLLILSHRTLINGILFLVCSFVLVLTHPYPPLNLLIMMVALFFSYLVLRSGELNLKVTDFYIKIESILMVMVLFVANGLIWGSNPFISKIILSSFSREKSFDIAASIGKLSYLTIYNDLSSILIGMAIFAILFWINIKRSNVNKFFLASLSLMMIGFFLAIHAFSVSIIPLPYRMLPFIYLPASILAAQGLLYLYGILTSKFSIEKSKTSIILITTLIFFFSLSSATVSPDFNIYSGNYGYRNSLDSQEFAVFNFLETSPESRAMYDSYYNIFIEYSGCSESLPRFHASKNNLTVLREYFLENSQLRSSSKFPKSDGILSLSEYHSLAGNGNWNELYENGEVWVFGRP